MAFIDDIEEFFGGLAETFKEILEGAVVALVAMARDLIPFWGALFHDKNIMILGAKQTGKTALIHLMSEGRPYEVINGQKVVTPTLLAVIVGREVNLRGPAIGPQGPVKIEADIAGESRHLWKLNIQKFVPDGIIYMIDGRLEGDALARAVREAFDDVLSCQTGLEKLRAFHLFVSFSDLWNSGKHLVVKANKLREVDALFTTLCAKDPYEQRFKNLSYKVHAVHLSKEAASWNEASEALQSFGAGLAAPEASP